MLLPTLKETSTKRLVTSKFGGYDHRLRIEDGQWWDMKNLTSDHWPMLASRPARGIGEAIPSPGGLTAKDRLIWVSGGSVVVNGKAVDLHLTEDGPKQLVSMGAFLVIWPDKKYINTKDLTDFGRARTRRYSSGSAMRRGRSIRTSKPSGRRRPRLGTCGWRSTS